ncbi:MAG: hypothetical protein AABY62_09120 [Pseudomonadota bacterium]|mgnify:CR=1 FL=1
MKYAILALMTFLAAIPSANAAGYPYQTQNPLSLTIKPDLTPVLKPAPSAPKPVATQAAVSTCGLRDFYMVCSRR